ncbi:hypothetical protein FHX37_0609 [Haloactinospora alba]|uniref:Uncharacterized protein n=1 Tax=Haloactinospora alba TaxID=405555 RepID=A0A543NFW2_9ACTN|nr:hypothetical protein [Haloactinospora alba]TQN30727.1 hypothetical protein FHX37_0609 [Haloactinospora alba]
MTDERDLIEYDEPRVLSEAFPDRSAADPCACTVSTCGVVLPADQMTVIKRHHARFAKGYLWAYCPDHFARTQV